MQAADSSGLKATGGIPTSQPFNSSTLSECSMAVHGASPTDGVAAVEPNAVAESKAAHNVKMGEKFPTHPVLTSNPLSDGHKQDKFESPKASYPTCQPGLGLKAAAFLNQGDSEDSDEEVRRILLKHDCCLDSTAETYNITTGKS